MNEIDGSSDPATQNASASQQPGTSTTTSTAKKPMSSKKKTSAPKTTDPSTTPDVASEATRADATASVEATHVPEKYDDFSFLPKSIQKILKEQGIEVPTSVQQAAIGPALSGRDVLVQAQTGSGKTLAFALPIGLTLEKPSVHGQPRALVLAPTRELANQVEAVFSTTLASLGLRCMPIIGGASYSRQKRALKDGVDIVVGTPGRIADLIQQKSLQLQHIQCFVLDEVDQMLDIGFADELNVVKDALPETTQVLFFSATIDKQMVRVTQKMLRDPVRLDLSSEDATPPNIEHACIPVKRSGRRAALINMLLFHAPKQALLFCATREECRDVSSALESRGFNAAPLSGDLSQEAREATLRRFHNGALQYLVATNVAARGIDIQALPLVLNYDVPPDLESYTHRIGRTGRAGEDGRAWTLVSSQTFRRYRAHMKSLDLPVKYLELPSQHEILSSSAQRQLTDLLEFADAPVHRSVRRLTDTLLETIEPDDALELVRGILRRHLASLHTYDSREIAVTKEELIERPSHGRGGSRGGPRGGGPRGGGKPFNRKRSGPNSNNSSRSSAPSRGPKPTGPKKSSPKGGKK